jgi:hypothetical protein
MQNADDIYESIFEQDEDYLYLDRNDQGYYLGLQCYQPEENMLLLMNTVSSTVYFKNKHVDIVNYLVEYSGTSVDSENPVVDIIQLCILPDLSYSCVVKTYWIRLIQRHWRSTLHRRRSLWKTAEFRKSRELGRTKMMRPSLRGLLFQYN